jgi:hypothetical protein
MVREERAENRELEKNEVLRDAKKDGLRKKQETTGAEIPCNPCSLSFNENLQLMK